MSFLRRLLGKEQEPEPAMPEWPPLGPITSWPVGERVSGNLQTALFEPASGETLPVVGESANQDVLDLLARGRTSEGVVQIDQTAVLVPDPHNAHDANAVRVLIAPALGSSGPWAMVGHLSRANAIASRPVIDRLAELGRVIGCHAELIGGWERRGGRDRGHIGVMLHLADPASLMADIDARYGADPRWPSEVTPAGKPYDRTDCPSCGVRLDPLPKAKKRCPSCGQQIYVRAGPDGIRHLLREGDLAAFEESWQAYYRRHNAP